VVGLAGALLLVVATFATIIEITVETTTRGVDFDAAQSGWDRHGPALIVLALLALWLLTAALRGIRIAMTGVALTGIVALAIAVHWDRSHVHDTGSVGEVYTEATANPGTGYYPRDARRGAAGALGQRAARLRPCAVQRARPERRRPPGRRPSNRSGVSAGAYQR
jgi:hypothetical protein